MSTQVQAKNNYWHWQTCNLQYTCAYWWPQVCQHQYIMYKLSIQCFHFLWYFRQPGPSEKQEVLIPNTLHDEGFQVVLNKKKKGNVEGVWKEATCKNHCHWQVIGRGWYDGLRQNPRSNTSLFTYYIFYLKY